MFNFRERRGAMRRISFMCKGTILGWFPFFVGGFMKLVSLKKQDLRKYTVDKEMLQKAGRPCVLIISLKYKGRRQDFAVPLRSNINPSTPKDDYFPLPPRCTTRPKHRHGIHYSKMFPINKSIAVIYRTVGNAEATRFKNIIDANEKQIIRECQEYLNKYAKGKRSPYSTNSDLLIERAL